MFAEVGGKNIRTAKNIAASSPIAHAYTHFYNAANINKCRMEHKLKDN